MNLRTYQEDLKRLVFMKEKETTESRVWGPAIPQRLRVYRNNTRSNWIETLNCDFTLTRSQFEPADWDALQRRYFTRHPPAHWELNVSMEPFVKFIAGQPVKAYVRELADYEWYDLKIFINRATVRRGLGVTNPTVVARVYQHQIFNWVQAGAPAARPPRQKPEVLVFYRDSKNTCHIREADPLMLLAMEHFRKPGARRNELEATRDRLLPQNTVRLDGVIDRLKQIEILL